MTDREMLGQRLCVGFSGTVMPEELRSLIHEYKIGNVAIAPGNIRDSRQLSALCRQIREMILQETGIVPIIAIDQEGGMVTRLPDPWKNAPGQMAVAAAGDPDLAFKVGSITASQLREYGISLNFAPVMDVNSNPQNPVIGVRSFGDDPQKAAEYGTEMMKGLLAGGVLPCLKHFPGHGDTDVDSRVGLPVIDLSLEELEERDLIPFEAGIREGAPCVMTSHILFPQIEKNRVPATMSRTIITGLLREKLGFQGTVISDDMEMEAISAEYGTEEGTLEAMKAGVDLVLIPHTPGKAAAAAETVLKALEKGELDSREFAEGAGRVLALKKRLDQLRPTAPVLSEKEQKDVFEQIRKQSITAVKIPLKGQPPVGEHPLFLGCSDYRVTNVSTLAETQFTFPEKMRELAGRGDAMVTSKDPDGEEIQRAVEAAQGHTSLILGMDNGHIFRGQIELMKTLAGTGIPLIVCALRDPYDLADMPKHTTAFAAWEYTRPQLEALWPVVDRKERAQGRLPLKSLQ